MDATAEKGFFRLKYTTAQPKPGESLEDADFDEDGIPNIDEIDPPGTFGQTDPLNPDTDGDSLLDGWEIANGLDPTDNGSINFNNGASGDTDGDGVSNADEQKAGTDPQNANDFPMEWISVNNSVMGNTHYSANVPHEGSLNPRKNWKRELLAEVDLDAQLEPVTIYNDVTSIAYPSTAGEALADADAAPTRVFLSSNAYPVANSFFFVGPDLDGVGHSAGSCTTSRNWLHLPPLPVPRQIPFLKVTHYLQDGGDAESPEDVEESFDSEAVTVNVPMNAIYSAPIDLETAASGVTMNSSAKVELIQIRILPDENMAGVVGDTIKSVIPGSLVSHFVTPREDSGQNQPLELKADGISSTDFAKYLKWGPGVEAGSSPDRCKVSRSEAGKKEVTIVAKEGGGVVARMFVWVVWAETTVKKGTAVFKTTTNGVTYQALKDDDKLWRFVFKIEPADLFDTAVERPDLSGERKNPPPGVDKPHATYPTISGDDAKRKWDLSRQMRVTIYNPDGLDMQGVTPTAWYGAPVGAGQTSAISVPFPDSDVEGNDDPNIVDEDGNPYQPWSGLGMDHAIGEISSSDGPNVPLANARGDSGAYFATELDFREFARLELWDGKRKTGKFWFRISDHKAWHHYLRATYNDSTSKWEDADSSSDEDN